MNSCSDVRPLPASYCLRPNLADLSLGRRLLCPFPFALAATLGHRSNVCPPVLHIRQYGRPSGPRSLLNSLAFSGSEASGYGRAVRLVQSPSL